MKIKLQTYQDNNICTVKKWKKFFEQNEVKGNNQWYLD